MNNIRDPERRYPDRSGNDTICRRNEGKADDFLLRGQGSWHTNKAADQKCTCVGLQRSAATNKQRHRDRFREGSQSRCIERRPKIYEKRSNQNTRPGAFTEQKEAAEGKTSRRPDRGCVPGRNCENDG